MGAFTDWFNNIWNGLFSSSSSNENRLIQNRGTNSKCDLTFPDTVNYDLAMDLYYNKKAGYKLGAFFCHSIIFIPMAFMGVPHFDIEDKEKISDSEFWIERLKYYNDKCIMMKQFIQRICHIAGTILVFPWFDAKSGYTKWQFIKPKYVKKVFINPDTKELSGIMTEIDYSFYDENDKNIYYTERIYYTEKTIKTIRRGVLPAGMREGIIRKNPTGILPVVFTNDSEPEEFEGHSEFERILPIIKAYSEINLAAHEETANLRPKLIQYVSDMASWLQNNGFAGSDGVLSDNISIADTDFIVNKYDVEKTEIEVPQNLVDNHIKMLNVGFWNIVEGSGIPEICFGLKTEGNHASAEEQMTVFLSYVALKQTQADRPYSQLITATLGLDAMAYNKAVPEKVKNIWNDLDVLTEVEKAEIFDKWCAGIAKLSENQGIDLESIHGILKQISKNVITENFEEFKQKIEEYGTLKAFLNQEYGGMRDFQGDEEQDNKLPQTNRVERNGHKKPEKELKI